MWKSCILAGPENIEIENQEGIFNKLKTELLSDLNNLQITCTLSDPQEKIAIESLINRLLDAGRLDTALRIGYFFNYKHKVRTRFLNKFLIKNSFMVYMLYHSFFSFRAYKF